MRFILNLLDFGQRIFQSTLPIDLKMHAKGNLSSLWQVFFVLQFHEVCEFGNGKKGKFPTAYWFAA